MKHLALTWKDAQKECNKTAKTLGMTAFDMGDAAGMESVYLVKHCPELEGKHPVINIYLASGEVVQESAFKGPRCCLFPRHVRRLLTGLGRSSTPGSGGEEGSGGHGLNAIDVQVMSHHDA